MRGLMALLLFSAVALGKTKIVVLGDSLTEGYGLARDKAFPALVEKKLNEAGKSVEVVNGGTSGATSASGPSRLRWFLKGKPQVLVLALGANDALRGVDPAETEKNLSDTIAHAKEQGLKVLLAGIKVPTNYGRSASARLEALYKSLAAKHQVPLLPFLLEGVGGVPRLNLPDGIHPNEAGHVIIADLVVKHLLPLL